MGNKAASQNLPTKWGPKVVGKAFRALGKFLQDPQGTAREASKFLPEQGESRPIQGLVLAMWKVDAWAQRRQNRAMGSLQKAWQKRQIGKQCLDGCHVLSPSGYLKVLALILDFHNTNISKCPDPLRRFLPIETKSESAH